MSPRRYHACSGNVSPWRGRVPFELLGRTSFPPVGDAPYLITLAPYGFFWFLLRERDASKVEVSTTPAEFETLVVTQGWSSLSQGQSRSVLERDVLPAFLANKRWYAERGNSPASARISATIPLVPADPGLGLAIIETKGRHAPATYLLPLTISWTRLDRERQNPNTLAAVRRGAREGTLLDATADPRFIAFLLDNLRASATIDTDQGRIEFKPTSALPKNDPTAMGDVHAVDTEQSNTTVVVETDCVVKLFRRLDQGVNPEIEIGRFLTETVQFSHMPPLLGSVELMANGASSAIAVVHGFVQNQGDAWTVTGAYLDRFVEEQRLLTAEAAGESDEQAAYLRRAQHVGRRVAELQLALASRDDLPDFAPEPITADDVRTWTESVLQRAERTLDELTQRRSDLTENDRQLTDALLSHRVSLPARLRELLPDDIDAVKIRHHGDFHLGQMLIVRDDVVIIDFEGEPRRSIEERRRKAPAARDVAGLIRSIDYSSIAALERALKSAPDEHGKIARALDGWRETSVSSFLSAYRQSLNDVRLWPQSLQSADRLLDFFLLEKAFYEIEYELAHRPSWLRVPLAGTWRILSRAERPAE